MTNHIVEGGVYYCDATKIHILVKSRVFDGLTVSIDMLTKSNPSYGIPLLLLGAHTIYSGYYKLVGKNYIPKGKRND